MAVKAIYVELMEEQLAPCIKKELEKKLAATQVELSDIKTQLADCQASIGTDRDDVELNKRISDLEQENAKLKSESGFKVVAKVAFEPNFTLTIHSDTKDKAIALFKTATIHGTTRDRRSYPQLETLLAKQQEDEPGVWDDESKTYVVSADFTFDDINEYQLIVQLNHPQVVYVHREFFARA